jgi:hypothetical protein
MKIKSNFSPRDLSQLLKKIKKDDSRFRFIEIVEIVSEEEVEIFWENGGVNNLWLKKISSGGSSRGDCWSLSSI